MIIIRYSEEDEEEGTLQDEDEANVEEDEVEEARGTQVERASEDIFAVSG